jgi:hypothetical protein
MTTGFTELALGAALNLGVALLIVRLIYYPLTQEKSYVFTFLAFNTVIYFMLSMLTSEGLSVGVGFGLFAIFSVLRYRTDEIPIREMTYLFVIIALPVINSLMAPTGNVAGLLLANSVTVLVMLALEKGWGFHFTVSLKIAYEQIALIVPERRDELLQDLRARTGLPIQRVRVGNIDFVHDMANLTVYYDERGEGAPQ